MALTRASILLSKEKEEEIASPSREWARANSENGLSKLKAAKKKLVGGKGERKLTDQLIRDLLTYYGLAIRRHAESVTDVQNAI